MGTGMDNMGGAMMVDEVDDDTAQSGDLFEMSVQDILSRNPINSTEEPPPEIQHLEDLVYYRYGFFLNDESYESPKGIKILMKDWTAVCRSVGGQHFALSSNTNQSPITDFVNILVNTEHPFSDVPAKYWDLHPENPGFLSEQHSHFRIELKQFDSREVLCFLHPRDLESGKCPAWVLAVPPMTALECVRRGFGPDPYVVAEYLASHGMEFRTLQQLPSKPSHEFSGPSTSILARRSLRHRFDSADFAKYVTIRDTYLENHTHARRALSMGGIVARLAREVLPVSTVLTGPSQDALEGKQDVLLCGNEVYVDDGLSVEEVRMICGTYIRDTRTRGMSFIYFIFCRSLPFSSGQTSSPSWFPPQSAWQWSGFNVGHWNTECEEVYLSYHQRAEGHVPKTTPEWRNCLKMTRTVPKLMFKMTEASVDYLKDLSSAPLRSC